MKTTSRLALLGFGLGFLTFVIGSAAEAKPAKVKAKSKSAPSAAVKWMTNYSAALAQAKKLKKPMFIDFSTDWCEGCHILEKTTFRDPKFVSTSRQWVMVMINPEKSEANAKLEKMYRVKVYPTLIMADSKGKFIRQVEGSYPTSMLLPEMAAAQKQLKSERMASLR